MTWLLAYLAVGLVYASVLRFVARHDPSRLIRSHNAAEVWTLAVVGWLPWFALLLWVALRRSAPKEEQR